MRARFFVLLFWACLSMVLTSQAAQVGPSGFIVRHEVMIRAAPTQVYGALLNQVGAWWNPLHTYSGDSRNLSIEPQPGGCFCESLRDGGAVEHLRVLYLAPAQAVRMSGALGPLQSSGLSGSLSWTLTEAPEGTKLALSYSVGGFMERGFEKIAPAVETVLGEQIQRLKLFIETGKPEAK